MATWACKHKACQGDRRGTTVCTEPRAHAEWHHMNTHAPVTVMQHGRPRNLRPEEAERLMGLPTGYTSTARDPEGANTPVPDLLRMQRIGGGIDIRSTRTLVR